MPQQYRTYRDNTKMYLEIKEKQLNLSKILNRALCIFINQGFPKAKSNEATECLRRAYGQLHVHLRTITECIKRKYNLKMRSNIFVLLRKCIYTETFM